MRCLQRSNPRLHCREATLDCTGLDLHSFLGTRSFRSSPVLTYAQEEKDFPIISRTSFSLSSIPVPAQEKYFGEEKHTCLIPLFLQRNFFFSHLSTVTKSGLEADKWSNLRISSSSETKNFKHRFFILCCFQPVPNCVEEFPSTRNLFRVLAFTSLIPQQG